MLLFSILIAGSFALGGLIANDIAPLALNAVRFLLAGIFTGVMAAMGPGFKREYFNAPWRYLVMGALFALYFVLMFEGLKTADPVSTSAVFTLTPMMSAVFGYFLLRQITTPRIAIALAIAAAGALWVIFRADVSAIIAFDIGRGEFVFFFGCIAHAIYTPMVRKLNRGEPALVFTFGMLVAGFFVLCAFGFRDILATDWTALSQRVWLTILYLVIFTGTTTFLLLQFSTMRLPSAKVMAYTYLTPAWVILLQSVLGNPWPNPMIYLGVAATVFALLILLRDEGAS